MTRPTVRGLAILASAAVGILGASATLAAELDCLIEPKVTVAISSSVEGLLETVSVDRGDLVEQGQVVATLESGVEKAAVALARARTQLQAAIKAGEVRVDFGGRQFTRAEEVFRETGISFKDVDEAATTKALAEISVLEATENKHLAEMELERAVAVLAVRTIRSPITGVVMERLLSPGEFAKQSPILRVAQLDPLQVEVIVPVSQLGKITVGMSAEIIPEAPVGSVYQARVKVVDRVVDAASGTFGVRLELPNPGYRLAAGLKCKVRFPR
ncbi:MAG TPA: efflux RND transporter periplasmic adaptor subunit [Candidatus Acidoferrum sp.]|nr:efflux RND transporter periplasmic adaptor subunit [Candidatus Acidoferrum sp.]